MNAFAHLACDLREKPIFPVEPRDKDSAAEVVRQMQFRKLLRDIAPSITSWAVPNAGKRGQWAQQQAKREGMIAGVFDEHYAWDGPTIVMLEWKDSTGALSQEQIDWGNRLHRMGFRVASVRSAAFAEALFREWGAPFIDRCGL